MFQVDGRPKFLGSFESEVDAALAFDAQARGRSAKVTGLAKRLGQL